MSDLNFQVGPSTANGIHAKLINIIFVHVSLKLIKKNFINPSVAPPAANPVVIKTATVLKTVVLVQRVWARHSAFIIFYVCTVTFILFLIYIYNFRNRKNCRNRNTTELIELAVLFPFDKNSRVLMCTNHHKIKKGQVGKVKEKLSPRLALVEFEVLSFKDKLVFKLVSRNFVKLAAESWGQGLVILELK